MSMISATYFDKNALFEQAMPSHIEDTNVALLMRVRAYFSL